ncbi:MAG: metallophosphoesterase, partial [Candidatus Margulisiibacteriota bacterium]
VLGFYGMILSLISILILPFVGLKVLLFGWPIALLIIVTYGFINAKKIITNNIYIRSKKLSKNYRLAFISDVHLGSQNINHFKAIINLIKDQSGDAILIGGDLIDSSSFDLNELTFLKEIEVPILFVTGNHEFYLKNAKEKLNQLIEFNINVIDYSIFELNEINVIGLGDYCSSQEKIGFLKTLDPSDRFSILLVHKPSLWTESKDYCDLMLSGHTHAGQLFPFQMFVKLQFPFYYGFKCFEGTYGYVSSGAGCWGPQNRIGSSNEVVIIHLNSEKLI